VNGVLGSPDAEEMMKGPFMLLLLKWADTEIDHGVRIVRPRNGDSVN
jgi:hypothetical protein